MKTVWVKAVAAAIAALAFQASPAMAQATRTWVSGVGDDVNPCSRTAPCKTFAGAISKTAAGGEIDCLDPGGFGTLTITKSITIDCTGTFGSSLAVTAISTTVNINDSSGPAPGTAKVVLKGLSLNGTGATAGTVGVLVSSARDVSIIGSLIQNFPNAGVNVKGSTKTRVTIDNSSFVGNAVGILIDNTTGQGSAKIARSLFTANTTSGVQVNGAGNSATVSANQFYGSPKALELLGGGTATSYGNNTFGTVGTDAPTVVPQG